MDASGPSRRAVVGLAVGVLAITALAVGAYWWTQLRTEVEPAFWQLDGTVELDSASARLAISVIERECASGASADGRIEVEVAESADTVTLDVGVRRRPGAQDCQGSPVTPYTVELDEPLGARTVLGETPDAPWQQLVGAP